MLFESDITSQYLGCSVCMEHLTKCANCNRGSKDRTEYIVYSCGFLYKQELRELFGVTDKLKDLWERRGTEFNLHIYLNGDTIASCEISKYSESGGARPDFSSLKCTQQELRIARRILQYITAV